MWGMYGFTPDPRLHEHWCSKGNENNEKAEFYELSEKRKDSDGPSYHLVNGRTGISMGWVGLEHLRKYYAPWNDPWKTQRAWAKQYGFTFKDD